MGMTNKQRLQVVVSAIIAACLALVAALQAIDWEDPVVDPGDGGAVVDGGAPDVDTDTQPVPDVSGVDYVAVADTYWYEGEAAQARFDQLAADWHVNGVWVWCEDAETCAHDTMPPLLANPNVERIWLNLYGHWRNISAPYTDLQGTVWGQAYSSAEYQKFILHGRDCGDGLGVTPTDASHVYGSCLGWADVDPSTGAPLADVLTSCFADSRCRILIGDDISQGSGPYDMMQAHVDEMANFFKVIWPGAYTMVRKQPAEIGTGTEGDWRVPGGTSGPEWRDLGVDQYQHLDAATSMFYYTDLAAGETIDDWVAAELAAYSQYGISPIWDLALTTGQGSGPVLEGSYTALDTAEIREVGSVMCRAPGTVEVSLYAVRKPGAALDYLTQPDISAAIADVGTICRGATP